jgi:hypothetical protein
MTNNSKIEICCECGRSVAPGSGLFMNRAPECNDYLTKKEMGRRFPRGQWVCIICDSADSDGEFQDLENVIFSISSEAYLLELIRNIKNGR